MSYHLLKDSFTRYKDKWKKAFHIGPSSPSHAPSTHQTPLGFTAPLPDPVTSHAPIKDTLAAFTKQDDKELTLLAPPETNNQPGMSSIVWPGVKTLLAVLESSSDAFGPLKSAVSGLNKCIEIYENAAQGQEDYNQLREDLEGLSEDLALFVTQGKKSLMTHGVKQICFGIEAELENVKKKQARSAAQRLFEGIDTPEEVLAFSRRIQGYLQRLSLNANTSILKAIDDLSMETRLANMLPTRSAIYNSSESEDVQRGGCAPKTREPQINLLIEWARNPKGGKVCWINGMAGTGKTTIAFSVCAALEDSFELGASFFCSRTIQECRQVKNIIPTVAYQLARVSMPFRSALVRVLESAPDAPTLALKVQYQKLIVEPLLEVKSSLEKGFIVIIDGLDECENEKSLGQVLDLLILSEVALPVRFLISSRPETEIYKRLANDARLVLHDLDSGSVKVDIEAYMRHELDQIPLTDAHWSGLLERCGVLFIYASTVCRYIEQEHKMYSLDEAVDTILSSAWVPIQHTGRNTIDGLYSTILTAAFDESRINLKNRESMRSILETVICAQVPMTLDALVELLGLQSLDRVNALLQPLRSVLNITPNTKLVTTLHASFPDYMLSRERSEIFHCAQEVRHCLLAKACLHTIDQIEPKFNICKLDSSYVFDEEIQDLDTKIKAISLGMVYASRYWSAHLDLGTFRDELVTMVYNFFTGNLLIWMEILNLTKNMRFGTKIIRQAEKWCSEHLVPDHVTNFARDAVQFVSIYAANPVCQSTPHIYVSMLPFWPRARPISDSYKPRIVGMLEPNASVIDQRQLTSLAMWKVSNDPLRSISLSLDGNRIAASTKDAIKLIDTSTGDEKLYLGDALAKGVQAVSISSDGTQMAFGSEDGVYLLDVRSEMVQEVYKHKSAVWSIAISPDGSRVAFGLSDGDIFIYASKQLISILKAHNGDVRAIAFSANGLFIASGSDDWNVRIWDTKSGRPIGNALQGHTDTVESVAYSFDDKHLASASWDGTIRVWNSRTGQVVMGPLKEHSGPVHCVTFSRNGTFIASGSADTTIRVYNVLTGQTILGPLEGHTGNVNRVIFSPDSTQLFSCSNDGSIRLWNIQDTLDALNPLQPASMSAFVSAQYSPDGRQVASGQSNGSVCVWDVQRGEPVLGPFQGHRREVSAINFAPSSKYIASASRESFFRIWSTRDGKDLHGPIQGHTDWVNCVRFSPDGSLLASGSDDYTVRIWDVTSGRPTIDPLVGHSARVWAVAFSPNGSLVASGSSDATIRLWDIKLCQAIITPLKGHERRVTSVEFSPDGSKILSGSWDGSMRLWDAQTGEPLLIFGRNQMAINSVSFSPDGFFIISGSRNKTAQIWDTQTGDLVLSLEGHSGWVRGVRFSPDGLYVVSCSYDGTIRFWDMSSRLGNLLLNKVKGPFEAHTSASLTPGPWSLNSSGWLIDNQQQRLVWVPDDLRICTPLHSNDFIICKQGFNKLNFDGAKIGSRWKDMAPIRS